MNEAAGILTRISQTCSSKQTPSNLIEGHLHKSTFRWLEQVNTVYIVSVFLYRKQ